MLKMVIQVLIFLFKKFSSADYDQLVIRSVLNFLRIPAHNLITELADWTLELCTKDTHRACPSLFILGKKGDGFSETLN